MIVSAAGESISGIVTTALGDFTAQLWLIAPVGLAIGVGILWGLPKGVRFLKSLAK